MSYYDHATHLALGLDRWDMRGQNGAGDARLAKDIHGEHLRPITYKANKVSFWQRFRLRFWRNGLTLQ